MMSDLKKFLVAVLNSHLGTEVSETNWDVDTQGSNVLEEFLGKENLLTVYATAVQQNNKQIIFYKEGTAVLQSNIRFVIFYKCQPCVVTKDNVLSIQVASLLGPPVSALYHTLQNVFTPLLIQDDKKNINYSNIQRQLANLQAGLRNAVLTSNTDADPIQDVDRNSLTVILTLDHEVEYWNNSSNTARNKDQRLSCSAFRELLKPLAKEFSVLDALPLNEVEDAVETAYNVLDDLWRHEPPFPKNRITHMMEIIANDLVQCISSRLADVNIWNEEFNKASELLRQCISIGHRWISMCQDLTKIFWPNYSLHPWTGDPYVPQNLVDLTNKLQEVLNIRTIHRQLVRLLTVPEEQDLKTSNMFAPFEALDILQYGPHSTPSWQVAFKKFEYLLRPAEERVAVKLKKQFSTINANTRQLLHEFSRYSELISRPVVKQTLQTERQYLLTSLTDYVHQLTNKIMSEPLTSTTKFDTPQIIQEIMGIRQLETKALDIQKTSEALLDDLQGYEELKERVLELLKDVKGQHNELFDSWLREITTQIKSNALSLKENEPVVQFSSNNKMMRVNYSPRLHMLIREVRQLGALGYHIPNNIEETCTHAKKFMKYANTLEQIANFHNTIGDRMIPSQRPMMLNSALELSKLVQEQRVVSWGDVQSVEKYVENLKEAVEKLSKDNGFLASCHAQILEKVTELETTDLIKYYHNWKEAMKNIRAVVDQVEQKGFKNMHSWKLDVDKQLYKVLEIQYLNSLDTLHLYLPEIHGNLVYRESQLQFHPNEDALREKYQQQLKKFLDIPKSFLGVSDFVECNMFAEIIEKNATQLNKVSVHTNDLFTQLQGVVRHWQSWLSLDTLDTSKLTTWQHWDLHFRASKTFGQEIAKLPSEEERVGCFIIGLSWLRSDLESHNRSYWSQLISSLKDSIAQDVVKLQQYVDTSTATLNRQPLTLEQMGEADASHADILRQKLEMEECYKEMARKHQMLSSWTREKIDSVNRLQAAWERLQSLLDNYEHIIAKQVETMKTTLKIESENLQHDLERFAAKWEQTKPRPGSGQIVEDTLSTLNTHLENLKEKRSLYNELLERKEKLIADHTKFKVDVPSFTQFEDIEHDLSKQEKVWALFEDFNKDLEKMSKEEWIVFRRKSYRLEELLSLWQEKLEKVEITSLITRLLQEIHKLQAVVPILKYVRGEDFTEKHWMEVFTLLKITPKPIDILYLQDFLNVSQDLITHGQDLQIICKRAASEVVVRQALAELDQWDVQSHFFLTSHVDSQNKTVMLVKDFKDILNKIGDNQSLLQSVKNSADYDSFIERAGLWESRLADLDHYLTSLAQIQRKWVYLEPIFGNGTLGHEKVRFDKVDKEFRHVLSYIEKDSRVTALHRYPALNSVLRNLLDHLSRCQNSLDNFLADKRIKFPRFLFLGDDDLLEVVGQSSKEQVIQAHLKKLFAGIHSIILDESGKNIVAMCSLQGETVLLNQPVNIGQPIEDWLNDLVQEMHSSLKNLLVDCLKESHLADPLKYPSQILCLVDSITFTSRCEHAITSMTLPPLLVIYKSTLNHYSSLELHDGNEKNLSSLSSIHNETEESNILELKLKALLLDTIHHITVIEELIEANVTKVTDWTWQKQLRFYSDSNGNVTVKMVHAEMDYSYEYLGNQPKLVRTPLTDKCFLTLTQGMHLGMGGNPYGPAGTGKTESVKALGSLLGRQVLVFNCDEGIDAASMGRILCGLVRSGAWGCFDEFNRLDEATLSAISMHIQPIQNALRTKQKVLTLLDQELLINTHCGIFVTLNPAGGGYRARNKLPDNLKQLFRPVVMTQPDHAQIAITLLHCDGYKNADVIGHKLVEVFSLASKLLSNQQHYDWGLRAIRTVLSGCSNAIHVHRKNSDSVGYITPETELGLVVKALKMDTMSKLTYKDSVKFNSLVSDIFPGVISESSGYARLIAALEETCVELGLQINKRQINKCIEFYEQLKQRMGVALVGPPSSGKSVLRQLLFNALLKTGKSLKQHVFNPKSMPRTKLLGQIDLDTRQWSDGVLTLCSVQVTSEPLDVWSWIVCDGDIDPEWVESLNSVLDDNRLLSLPSGWRVQFGPNVNFVFETHDLSYASPATISRMGIVFLDEEDVTLKDVVTSFVNEETDSETSILKNFIEDYFYRSVDWVINDGELIIPHSKVSVVQTGLSHISEISSKAQFTVGLLNGLGGQLTHETKEVFVQQVFEWVGEIPPPSMMVSFYNKERDMINSYNTNISSISEEDTYDGLPLIMTSKVCHIKDCLRVWLQPGNEQHFLLVGPHGSAKTKILEHLVNERDDIEMATIYCSAHITPQYIIHKLTNHCMIVSSHKGRIYRPKKGHLVLHIKNMHLLKCDQWNSNMVIAFLHQLITYKGLFDSEMEWVGVDNITIVGSSSSASNLSIRFTSILHVFNVVEPSIEDLHAIFTLYLSHLIKKWLVNSTVWTKNKIAKLTTTMLTIYFEVLNTFSVVQKQHYSFSPHSINDWCDSIVRYKYDVDNVDIEAWLLEIICYESLRLFKDRLVLQSDREKFDSIVNNVIQSQWNKPNIIQKFKDYYVPNSQFTSYQLCTSLSKASIEEWTDVIKKGITQFEREGQNLDVVIIPELLHLTSSIGKALTTLGGGALLIGRSGVGRRSAVKIISALQSAKLIIPISAQHTQFSNDLKCALQCTGLEGEHAYLLLEDHILNEERVLDTVNILLHSGEVPGLYNGAEMESLVAGLKDEASRENYDGNLLDYFNHRVRTRLHIVACLDIHNENLPNILKSCPSLHQKCGVVWLSEWSATTMAYVSKILTEKIDNEEASESNAELVRGFCGVHNTVNLQNGTPSRFVSLIKTYLDIYSTKKNSIVDRQRKLLAGVSKLTEARNVVADLKQKAGVQQEQLAEKQSKANAALDMISNTMKSANNQKQDMEVLKKQTERESEQLAKRKKEIEVELSEVKPLIEEAQSAVGNIKSESLSEIRSLRAPPDIIRDILEGVLRLMGTQDTSWNSMKNFLSKRGVKEDIRAFDATKITTENRQAVERLMSTRADSFDSKNAKRASVAAAPLAAWVRANVKFSHVLDKIQPLEREQNKLKQNLVNAELQLEQLSTGLSSVDTAVSKLKVQLATYTKEAAEIEIHLTKAQETLVAAEGLVAKLSDEYDRWQSQLQELSEELSTLPLNCLLASAYITYLSSETEDLRINILNEWLDQLTQNKKQHSFVLEQFLTSERELVQWQSEGLQTDQLSIQNAIIILKSRIYPLLLDPTSVAVKWVQAHLKHKNIEVISQNSKKFNTSLEHAVRFGKVLIIEEVESVSPVLFPLLKNQFSYQGERKLVNLNGKLIDFHGDFQLVLSSRNAQLQLTSDVASVLSVVNFVTTHAGLAEQLLMGAIRQESPELEERRKQLLRERETLQEKQYNLQNRLLEDLAQATGDILQNKGLIESLNETKASSNAITIALKESANVQEKLQQECNVYKDLSMFGSSLYFAAAEFSKINVLYSLSISAFIRLFLKCLTSFEGNDNFGFLQKSILQSVYKFMSRGIFKADRLKFALHLVHKMYPQQLPEEEWFLFLREATPVDRQNPSQGSDNLPSWIPDHIVQNVLLLRSTLQDLYNSLQLNDMMTWKNFMEKNECEKYLPSHCKLTEFQKILLVQALRPDRLHTSLNYCVLHLTGLKYLNPDVLQMSQIFNETICIEPILFIITSGSDPSSEMRALAYKKIGEDKITEIAMGEGQEAKALTALHELSQLEHWLILKNLHLVTSWLPVLCQHLQNIKANKNFRFWLITEPHPLFSPVLAQNSLKIVYEAPQGVKNNLIRTYTTWQNNYIEKLSPTGARIFFVLACVHALLQERRTYIPQGWSKLYEFGDIDLSTAIKLAEELWQSQNPQVQWNYLIGWCSNVIYGGRIENNQDLYILEVYLRQYFTDEILSSRWKPFGLDNALPKYSNFEEYMTLIGQLSDKDLPSYFGLPENIDRAWEKITAGNVISELKGLHLAKTVPKQIERDDLCKGLMPFLSLWKKLNQGHDFIRVSVPVPVSTGSPILMFISEEHSDAICLIQKIHKCFAVLNKTAKGGLILEGQDLETAHDLLNHKTPKVWQTVWNGPTDPANYLKLVLFKTSQIAKLKDELNVDVFFKKPLNLNFLFNPMTYLAAFKQHVSRKCNIPLDQLVLKTSWRASTTENAITLTGLLIEGGLFDGLSLSPCSSNFDSITAVPNCFLNWTQAKGTFENNKYLDVPLYYSSSREKLLTYIQVSCEEKEKDKWIQAGLAFYIGY